jgi:hypothetical protein
MLTQALITEGKNTMFHRNILVAGILALGLLPAAVAAGAEGVPDLIQGLQNGVSGVQSSVN